MADEYNPLTDATDVIRNLIAELQAVRERKASKPEEKREVEAPAAPAAAGALFDGEVLRLIRKDKRGAALWDGHWESLGLEDSSHSGADFALCQRLAFYCGKDAAQIDRLFRLSALYREDKWDASRPGGSYGSLTIERAIAQTSTVYSRQKPAGGTRAAGGRVNGAPAAKDAPAARTAAAIAAAEAEPMVEGAPELLSQARTDIGNARRLRSLYGDLMLYSAEEKGWIVWTGRIWGRQDGRAQELAKSTACEFTRQALRQGEKTIMKFAFDSQNKSRTANALAMLSSELTVSSADFDREPHLLNCQNGTLDLRTGEIREHRREDLITKLIRVDYNPQAGCPHFLAMIARLMGHTPDAGEGQLAEAAEKIDYLQLALGYSITGETKEKAVFVAYGDTDTGKTTLLGTIRELMGGGDDGYAATMPLEVIMGTDRSNSADAYRVWLRGARFVQSSETEEGQRMVTAHLKRICQGQGGTITACRKYEHPITFLETHKLWIDANYRPELPASDTGAWRRLHLIPFNVQIPKAEQDRFLYAKLREESEGILAWLVAGARRWYTEGLPKSEVVDRATEDWREAVNRVKIFLDEACLTEVNASVPNKNLYGAYKAWCEENGERFLSNRKFTEQMRGLGYKNHKLNEGQQWCGLRFRLP